MLAGHFLNLFRLPRSYLSSHQLCSRSLPNLFKAYSSTHCFWVSLSDQPHLWENHCVNSRNHSLELDESVWVSWCHQSILETLIKFSLAADWIRLVRSTIIIDNRIDIGLEGTWNIESNLNQWQTTWWDRKVYGNQTQKRRIASDNMSCQEGGGTWKKERMDARLQVIVSRQYGQCHTHWTMPFQIPTHYNYPTTNPFQEVDLQKEGL